MARRDRGGLETEILQLLWQAGGPVTSRGLRESFTDEARPALTTLLTVLSRLEHKALVQRQEAPGGALFSAARPEADQIAHDMSRLLHTGSDREAALQRFAGSLSAQDAEVLRRVIDSS